MLLNVAEKLPEEPESSESSKAQAQFRRKGGGWGSDAHLCRRMASGVARDSRLMPVPIATADTRCCAYGFAFRTILTRYAFRFSRSSSVSAPGSQLGGVTSCAGS